MARLTLAALVAIVAVSAALAPTPAQAARKIDISGRKLLDDPSSVDAPAVDFPSFGPVPALNSMDSKPPSYNGVGPCYGYGTYGYGYSGYSGYGYSGYGYSGYYGYHGMCSGMYSPIQG